MSQEWHERIVFWGEGGGNEIGIQNFCLHITRIDTDCGFSRARKTLHLEDA